MSRLLLALLIAATLFGCGKTYQSDQSEIAAWDSHIPLDQRTKKPSFSDRLSSIFSDGKSFHFRKVRWGYSRERVELAEAGNTIFERKGNAIVYKVKVNGVYCKLIYTFKDNKLRTAGYMTITPLPNVENLIREAVDKHGTPDTYKGGEMVWKTPDSVIFSKLYPSVTKVTPTKYAYSSGGLLADLLKKRLEEREPGVIRYWDGIYAHVDPAFFDELHEVNFPLAELTFYEKQLVGIILRRGRTIYPGLGTIPQ